MEFKYSSGTTIWQLVQFKSIPFTCFLCKKYGDMSRECTKGIKKEGKGNNMLGASKEKGSSLDERIHDDNTMKDDTTGKTKLFRPMREGKYIPPGRENLYNTTRVVPTKYRDPIVNISAQEKAKGILEHENLTTKIDSRGIS